MSAPGPEEGEDAHRAGQLLSKANLLRVRGQLDDAIAHAKEALALAPGDAGACALLGDLYAAQGHPEEALPWLAMAVDAAPENPSYRERLRRLAAVRQAALERGEGRSREAETSPEPAPESGEATDESPTPEAPSRDGHSNLVRGIYIACGVIFVAFALASGLLLRQGASRKAEPTDDGTPRVSTPLAATPAPLPPASASASVAPSPGPISSPVAPGSASPTAGIVLRLGASGVAYLNPATGIALRDAPVPVAQASKELLLREALRQAAAVSRADVRVKSIEVQLKDAGNSRAALRARIGAIDAIKVTDTAPLSDLLDLFTLLEWRPDIR